MCVTAPARLVNPDTACWRFLLAPIAAIEYLQAALTLASNHDLGVALAELDLPNRPASGVKLAENDGRAVPGAARCPAGTLITAPPDLNGRRRVAAFADRMERDIYRSESGHRRIDKAVLE
jgi:hypothetical protein